MKPGKAIFLVIGSIIWLLFDLSQIIYRHVEYKDYETWTSLILSVVFLTVPVVFILLGYTYLKPDPALRKKVSVAGSIVSFLWIATMVYYTISGFDYKYYGSDPLRYIMIQTFYIYPILLTVFWLVLNFGNTRKAAWWLLMGSLSFTFGAGFEKLFNVYAKLFNGYSYGYDFSNGYLLSVSEILGILSVLFPVSMVVFAVGLLKETSPVISEFKQEEPPLDTNEMLDALPVEAPGAKSSAHQEIPRMIDWISDFLILLIPVFGFVFLIWRGQNKKDKFRRKWALATLFWSVLAMAFYLLMYYPLLEYVDREGVVLVVLVSMIVALLVLWVIGLSKARKDDFDDQVDESVVPSVLTWTGRTFVAGIPLVGLILQIVWAVDPENTVRRNWALARLLMLGVMALYYLNFYKWFLFTVGDLSRLLYRF